MLEDYLLIYNVRMEINWIHHNFSSYFRVDSDSEYLRDRRREQRHHRDKDHQRKLRDQKAEHGHDGDDELQREDEYAVSSKSQQQRAQRCIIA